MTSPNVGQVTVGVKFDLSKVQGEVAKSVLPEIAQIDKGMGDLKKTIDSISSEPLDEILKHTDALAKSDRKLHEQRRLLRDETKRLSKTEIARGEAQLKLDEAQAKVASAQMAIEIKRAQKKKITNELRQAEIDAIAEQQAAETKLHDILDRRLSLEEKIFEREIQMADIITDERTKDHRELLDMMQEKRREYEKVAEQETNIYIRENRKRMREAEKAAKQEAAAREDKLKAPIRGVGQIARESLGLTPRMTTGPFLVIVGAVAAAAGALASATQAMWAVPAAAGAATLAIGTLSVGTMGFSDTIESLLDGDLEKFAELINKLSPNAQQAALSLQQLGPQFSALKTSVQDALFKDSPQMIQQMTAAYLPIVEQAMNGTAASMNRFVGKAFKEMLSPEVMGSVNRTLDNFVKAFENLEGVARPLVSILADIMEVGSSTFPGLAEGLAKMTQNFANFIKEAKESGKLSEWLQRGYETVGLLIDGAWQLGRAFMGLAPVAEDLLPLVVGLLEGIADLLNEFPNLAYAAAGAFIAFKTLPGLISLIADLGLVKQTLGVGLPDAATRGAKGMTSRLGMLVAPGGILTKITFSIMGILDGLDRIDGHGGTGNDAVGIGEMALAGGLAGSMFGPWGALAGLGVGTVAGVGNMIHEDSKNNAAAKAAAAAQSAQNAKDYPGVKATPGALSDILLGQPLPSAGPSVAPPAPPPTDNALTNILLGAGASAAASAAPGQSLESILAPGQNITNDKLAGILAPGVDPGDLPPVPVEIADGPLSPDWGETNLLPVPPAPALGPDGKPLSDSDIKKQIEDSLDPSKFAVDPYEGMGGVQNQPGWPGRPTLGVTVDNMPATLTPTMPGMTMPLAGIPSMPTANAGLWDQIAKYESNNDWSNNNTGGHMTSSGAPRGGLQITDGTWKAYGGTEFAPTANLASKEQQIAVAQRIAWDGYQGTKPQGLGAWEVVTQGKVAGVNANTPKPAPSASPLPAEAGYTVPQVAMPNPAAAPIPIVPIPQSFNAHTQVTAVQSLAQQMGLTLTSGRDNHDADGGHHPAGQAGDFSNVSGWTASYADNSPEMERFFQSMKANFGPYLAELIYDSPTAGQQVKNGQLVDRSVYGESTMKGHTNHVHLAIADEMAQSFLSALQSPVPQSLKDKPYTVNGMPVMDPGSGDMGYMQYDQKAITEADERVKRTARELGDARKALAAAEIARSRNLITEDDLIQKQQAVEDRKEAWLDAQDKLLEEQRGDFRTLPDSMTPRAKAAKQFNLDDLPWGDPRRILGGALQGAGASSQSIGAILGESIAGAAGVQIPGPMGFPGIPTAPSTDVSKLVEQRNPMALFQAAGFDVPDYTRQGAGESGKPASIEDTGEPPTDALGRVYSDTAALVDRTFTDMDTADKARHDQVMTVLNEVSKKLGIELLGPAVADGVAGGVNGLTNSATQALGQSIGQAAGPIIGQDVAAAVQGAGGSSANSSAAPITTGINAAAGAMSALIPGSAEGGPIVGPGTATSDSILARLSNGEYVLSAKHVQALGGFGGVNSMLRGLPGFATGGGVNVDRTVGAEFFGVSQVPILSTIINLLVNVLLKVIGVEIEARDTLDEIGKDFRDFRGDFQAFDASGRLFNDTSGLLDRSGSSEQAAVDERIRILKAVLEGLIKFIIEKIIVPIGKAVANAVIQAGAGAASGAIGASFPGGEIVGQVASAAISSAGSATVDIIAEVGATLAEAAVSVGLDAIGSLLKSFFPGITTGVFGGGLTAMIVDPITNALNGVLGGVTMLFGSVFGGLASLIPGLPFDQGGVATGTGLMPKATLSPERVLSPRQTMLFEKLVATLEGGGRPQAASTTTIHAPFTVVGGEQGARETRDRLLALMS